MIYLLPLIAGIFYGLSSIVNKKVTTILDNPVLSSLFYNIFSLPFALLLLFEDTRTTGIIFSTNTIDWMFLVVGGILCAFCFWGAFISIRNLPVSEQILLSRFSVLTYTIGGFLILGETVTQLKLIGILLILSGVLVSSVRKGKFVFNKWALMQLLASFGFGLNVLIDNHVSINFSSGLYVALNLGITSIFLVVIALCSGALKGIKDVPKRYTLYSAITGIFSLIGYYLVIRCYDLGGLVVVTGALSQLRLVIVILYGYLVLKEKNDLFVKILGIITVVGGLILLKI
ncbi:TPA: hypothetical protein DCP76_00635 [Patescibacteria group bacterium]|nr:hypothetical protein [Patescibacteria group bacterium]HAM96298.1 hypothetical protein [Patescibacteria group bacterium]